MDIWYIVAFILGMALALTAEVSWKAARGQRHRTVGASS